MPFRLPVSGLPKQYLTLTAGIYWVFAGRQDADQLSSDILASLEPSATASLVCDDTVLATLLRHAGSRATANIHVHTLSSGRISSIRRTMQGMLSRIGVIRSLLDGNGADLLLIRAGKDAQIEQLLGRQQLLQLNNWLKKNNKILLVLAESREQTRIPVQSVPGFVQGCAFLERDGGGLSLNLFFWANEFGVTTGTSYLLRRDAKGLHFSGRQEHDQNPEEGPAADHQTVYFQRDSLRGLPLLSNRWTMIDSYAQMLERAEHSHGATLVFALGSSDE